MLPPRFLVTRDAHGPAFFRVAFSGGDDRLGGRAVGWEPYSFATLDDARAGFLVGCARGVPEPDALGHGPGRDDRLLHFGLGGLGDGLFDARLARDDSLHRLLLLLVAVAVLRHGNRRGFLGAGDGGLVVGHDRGGLGFRGRNRSVRLLGRRDFGGRGGRRASRKRDRDPLVEVRDAEGLREKEPHDDEDRPGPERGQERHHLAFLGWFRRGDRRFFGGVVHLGLLGVWLMFRGNYLNYIISNILKMSSPYKIRKPPHLCWVRGLFFLLSKGVTGNPGGSGTRVWCRPGVPRTDDLSWSP